MGREGTVQDFTHGSGMGQEWKSTPVSPLNCPWRWQTLCQEAWSHDKMCVSICMKWPPGPCSWPSALLIYVSLFFFSDTASDQLLTADRIRLVRTICTLLLSIAAPPSRNTLSILAGKICGCTCLLCCREELHRHELKWDHWLVFWIYLWILGYYSKSFEASSNTH